MENSKKKVEVGHQNWDRFRHILLGEAEARPSNPVEIFAEAFSKGDTKKAKDILNEYDIVNYSLNDNAYGWRPLLYALVDTYCWHQELRQDKDKAEARLNIIDAIVQDKDTNINASYQPGTPPIWAHHYTAIYTACEHGRSEIVDMMLKREDIDVSTLIEYPSNYSLSSDFHSCFSMAMFQRNFDIAAKLLESGKVQLNDVVFRGPDIGGMRELTAQEFINSELSSIKDYLRKKLASMKPKEFNMERPTFDAQEPTPPVKKRLLILPKARREYEEAMDQYYDALFVYQRKEARYRRDLYKYEAGKRDYETAQKKYEEARVWAEDILKQFNKQECIAEVEDESEII